MLWGVHFFYINTFELAIKRELNIPKCGFIVMAGISAGTSNVTLHHAATCATTRCWRFCCLARRKRSFVLSWHIRRWILWRRWWFTHIFWVRIKAFLNSTNSLENQSHSIYLAVIWILFALMISLSIHCQIRIPMYHTRLLECEARESCELQSLSSLDCRTREIACHAHRHEVARLSDGLSYTRALLTATMEI